MVRPPERVSSAGAPWTLASRGAGIRSANKRGVFWVDSRSRGRKPWCPCDNLTAQLSSLGTGARWAQKGVSFARLGLRQRPLK